MTDNRRNTFEKAFAALGFHPDEACVGPNGVLALDDDLPCAAAWMWLEHPDITDHKILVRAVANENGVKEKYFYFDDDDASSFSQALAQAIVYVQDIRHQCTAQAIANQWHSMKVKPTGHQINNVVTLDTTKSFAHQSKQVQQALIDLDLMTPNLAEFVHSTQRLDALRLATGTRGAIYKQAYEEHAKQFPSESVQLHQLTGSWYDPSAYSLFQMLTERLTYEARAEQCLLDHGIEAIRSRNKTKQLVDFFDRAFEGQTLPTAVKNLSVAFCKKFNISGICDPMYISNVTAMELQIGDGCGHFEPIEGQPDANAIERLAQRLCNSYSTNTGGGMPAALACLQEQVSQDIELWSPNTYPKARGG